VRVTSNCNALLFEVTSPALGRDTIPLKPSLVGSSGHRRPGRVGSRVKGSFCFSVPWLRLGHPTYRRLHSPLFYGLTWTTFVPISIRTLTMRRRSAVQLLNLLSTTAYYGCIQYCDVIGLRNCTSIVRRTCSAFLHILVTISEILIPVK